MSQCLVPNWNLKQGQEQVEGEEGSRSYHVQNDQNHLDPATTILVPMSNYEAAELTWDNGQLSMHGLGELLPTVQAKPKARDTLESIVQEAICQHQKSNFIREDHAPKSISSTVASTGGSRGKNSGKLQMLPTRKRARSNSDYCGRNFSISSNVLEDCDLPSGCPSASATFCRDNDTTMMTWASLESDQSLKNKNFEEDSACHCGSETQGNQDEDRYTKAEIGHSNSTRRNRAAATHNQSERRRRDRINQKMKALQRLVPNASKTDKASMLDEVINYLKQLQAQIQMMGTRSMPQMIMPLAMQQQLQMFMLARMGVGLGMGMGMVNINNMPSNTTAPRSFPQLIQPSPVGAPATAPVFVGPSFMMPAFTQARAPAPPKPKPASAGTNASIALPDPYSAILTQSANMDPLNNMAALYRQQMIQNSHALSRPSRPHHGQGD